MKIRYINATHPGACHDSFVWSMSGFKKALEQEYLEKGTSMWLLGEFYPQHLCLLSTSYHILFKVMVATHWNHGF